MKQDILKIDENGHVIDIDNNCELLLSGVDTAKPYQNWGDSIKNTKYMVQCINSHGPLRDMLAEFCAERFDNDTWKDHELTIKAHEYLSMLNGDKSKIRSGLTLYNSKRTPPCLDYSRRECGASQDIG